MASFDIDASRYVLGNNSDNIPCLLDEKTEYIIPIYQRPYAWTEKQITQFVNDIFSAFSENNRVEEKEPMFIGTMQLAKAENGQQDIIDGQQRFTTFFLLFKVLEQLFPEASCFGSSAFSKLSTKVNNGEQQLLLEEFKSDFSIDATLAQQNIYCENALLIKEAIVQWFDKSETYTVETFPYNDLQAYINGKIYFVIITTQAGLSKTLKIFDTINTAGLPLDTNDLFKIRMYEYMQRAIPKEENSSDAIFTNISNLYEEIDHFNKVHNTSINMQAILGIYQTFLIAKYDLPTATYSLGVDTFYDRLFETLFKIAEWPNFKREKGQEIKLCLDEIKGIIKERLDWHIHWHVEKNYSSVIDFSTYILWSWTRYARYRKFIYIFLLQFQDDKEKYQKLQRFINAITKLYIVYSINYQKVVNSVRFAFNHQLLKTILNCSNDIDVIIGLINEKLNGSERFKYSKENYELFHKAINTDVFSITTSKNLLCRMSAAFAAEREVNGLSEVTDILFSGGKFDIEHILSQTKEENEPDRDVAWKSHINRLGNIVLLERNLNRGIKNYADKKIDYYQKSELSVVKVDLIEQTLNGDFANWSIDLCEQRTKDQIDAISSFVFSESN